MTQDDINFLESKGWVVECESPLEIREEDSGSFATGYAANLVLESLRDEEKVEKKFNLNSSVAKLMERAFDDADYPSDQQYRIEPNKYFCAKFAELIVKECIKVHEDNYGVGIIGSVLKKHFGVEE